MPENNSYHNSTNYIFASLFTGVFDVNRNELLQHNDFSIIEKWYTSILHLEIHAIVFHNTFSKDIVEKYTNEYIQFVEVKYETRLKPNVFRYFIYRDYLRQNLTKINHLFVTDIADVEVMKNPFESQLFVENANALFCGDEPIPFDNDWMRNHCSHLRNIMPEFRVFEALNQQETLLNCGVIGGNVTVMKWLLDKMVEMHEAFSFTNTSDYTLDMGVFNFVARTAFAQDLIHGSPVNTVFKKYESQRTDCWFRHK